MFDELMRAGWPAIEEVQVDGWVVRFSGGVTQRANSVLPLAAPFDIQEAVHRVEQLYADRGLPVVFQLGAGAVDLDRVLGARGYEFGSPTVIQTAAVDVVLGNLGHRGDIDIDIAEAASPEWLGLWWAVDGRGDADALAVAEKILAGGPAIYATIRDAHGAAAVGRLALVGEWGGVYCLAVRPDVRRLGLGAAVLAELLAAGRERGVRRSWLLVRVENAGARRLYQRAGYAVSAHYHYRSHRGQEPVQDVHAET